MQFIPPASLTAEKTTSDGPLIQTRDICARYNISARTLDRWLTREDLCFPRPITINRRRYWYSGRLTAWERTRASEKASTL